MLIDLSYMYLYLCLKKHMASSLEVGIYVFHVYYLFLY